MAFRRQPFVNHLLVWVCLAALPAVAEPPALSRVLAGVESRYNRARTLQVRFQETYLQGRNRRTESGALSLRKPGRMRWEYSSPPGKLFVSDGKFLYLYLPSSNRVEKMKAKESEDLRAPLAFLLGRLDFRRDFARFESHAEDSGLWVRAEPKSASLPYLAVEFVVAPDYRIRRVRVTGQDRSVFDFQFEEEKVNPPIDDRIFRFTPPPGAEVVESGG
jgi:outer membrane lipoprotein carrier protein